MKVLIGCLLLLVKTLVVTVVSEDDINVFRKELQKGLQAVVEEQNRVNDQQRKINLRQEAEINNQRDEIKQQRDEINQQRDIINQLQASMEIKQDRTPPATANTIQPTVHACVGESLTMHCDAGFTITVLRAEYGRYADDCSSGCCEPTGADCTEIMAETNAAEWQSIKASCDGQTTCDYLYTGQLIKVCALNRTADYVKFLYHCTDFVGFSAYTTSSSQNPNDGDIVLFPGVETNVGGGYDNSTSVFTCPLSGYYYIFLHSSLVLQPGDNCYLSIRKDGDLMAQGNEHSVGIESGQYIMTSLSVLLQCDAESQIWIQADYYNQCTLFGGTKRSTFGGFLLLQL